MTGLPAPSGPAASPHARRHALVHEAKVPLTSWVENELGQLCNFVAARGAAPEELDSVMARTRALACKLRRFLDPLRAFEAQSRTTVEESRHSGLADARGEAFSSGHRHRWYPFAPLERLLRL